MRLAQCAFFCASIIFFLDNNLLSNPQSETAKKLPTNQTAKPNKSSAIPQTLSPEDLIAKAKRSVVVIECIKKYGNSSIGAGFVVGPNKYISTNAHVVNGCAQIQVQSCKESAPIGCGFK
jgi:S1-C subfamily serine protease